MIGPPADLRAIRAALEAHFRDTGNRPCTLRQLVLAVAARGVALPAGPQASIYWAEERIRRAMGAPGFAPVGRDNGRKLWAMMEPGDGPPPAKIVVRPYMPEMEGEAP